MYARPIHLSAFAFALVGALLVAPGCSATPSGDLTDEIYAPEPTVKGAKPEKGVIPGGSIAEDGAAMLSLLSPSSGIQNAAATINIAGGGFAASAIVKFNGQAVPSLRQSDSAIVATLTGAHLAQRGTFPVVVSVGGVDSNPIMFSVTGTDASVKITGLSPSHVMQFSAATALSVQGIGFTQTSRVSFNGLELPTTFGSSSNLTVSVPASSLTKSGTYPVSIITGDSPSVPFSFTVDSRPRPTYSSHDLPYAFQGQGATDMRVYGTAFDSTTRVAVYSSSSPTGEALTPSFNTSSQVFVTVPVRHFSAYGDVTVKVYNLLPNGQGHYALNTGTIRVQ